MIQKIIRKLFPQTYKTIAPDAYIKRLGSMVIGEGMLHEGNIYLMNHAIQHLPARGAVLEIGCYGGLSGNLICYLLKKHNKSNPFFAVDLWEYEGFEDAKGKKSEWIDGRSDITRQDFMNYLKAAYQSSINLLNAENKPFTCHSDSILFLNKWKDTGNVTDIFGREIQLGGAIAFAYIDGNHAYQHIRQEFEKIDPLMTKGGFILFDDSDDASPFGSAKLMKEVIKNTGYQFIDKNPNYLFQKI
jgi:hypothetical protein